MVCLSVSALAQNDTATYEYDALGRLTKVIYPNGQEKEYHYDPAGNRTEDLVLGGDDGSVNDNVPTLGIGPNLINLINWPKGNAPSGPGDVTDWPTSATYYNEARWARVSGPGESNNITAMEVGQTESDNNGGGTNSTNTFTIDPTRAYEFSIYIRKYDISYQSLYVGTVQNSTNPMVKYANSTSTHSNPYFSSFSTSVQATYIDPNKWYRLVAYVFPEGYPVQNNSDWGGIYDVATGLKQMNVVHFRWNEGRATDLAYARFFNYYSAGQQNTFTNYFYLPEVRVTDITYTPVVPSLSITETHTAEGDPIFYDVHLSQTTTVDVKVNYVVDHPGGSGSASSGDYTAISGTLTIPQGATKGTITVSTTEDSLREGAETIRLTLSSPVRATISETTELANIIDDDTPPSFSINNVSVTEGGTLSFTVSKANETTQPYSVDYATSNGSAAAGSDYTSKSGTLTFSSSQSSQTVSVSTIQDGNIEANENLYVNLSNSSGASTISDGQGIGTINNDDTAPNAVNDSYFFILDCCAPNPDQNISVLLNDSDPDGDPLTITSVTQPSSGFTVTFSSGSQSLKLNYNASLISTSFTYTISDGNGNTDTATVTVTTEETSGDGEC